MSAPNASRARPAALAAILVLAFAATYLVLDRTEHRPGWLTVEMPAYAVAGRPLEARVALKGPPKGAWVAATLHRAGDDRRLKERIAAAGPAREAAQGVHVFRFEVPALDGLRFVSAVVYLGPDGRWTERTAAAHTKLIPVRAAGAEGPPPARRTAVYPSTTAADDRARDARAARTAVARPRGEPSPWVHPIIAALLLAGSVLGLSRARRRAGQRPGGGDRTVWLVLAAVMALCAALELSGLAGHVADWGRRLAEQAGVYESRKPFQKAAMAAVAAASLGLFVLFLRAVRRPGPRRTLWGAATGLAAYLALAFVSALSFHAVDVARGLVWHGWSAVDAARGAGALAALLAAGLSAGKDRASGPI